MTGPDDAPSGCAFPDLSRAYDPSPGQARAAARDAGIASMEASISRCPAVTRDERRARLLSLDRLGDAVGMSTVTATIAPSMLRIEGCRILRPLPMRPPVDRSAPDPIEVCLANAAIPGAESMTLLQRWCRDL